MKQFRFYFLITCSLFMWTSTGVFADNDLVVGRVVDAETRYRLASATVWILGTNQATVTNAKGEFSIRVGGRDMGDSLSVSFVGYRVLTVAVSSLNKKENVIALTPTVVALSEVVVRGGTAEEIVRLALKRVPDNYPNASSNLVTFYREMVRKGSNYIALAEAVLFAYKASYLSREVDASTIYKGRRNVDYNKLDTLLFKLQGGITTAFELDVIKNPENIYFIKDLEHYQFAYTIPKYLFDRYHYVVDFSPKVMSDEEIFFRGKIFLDAEKLAITRMEFNMNVEDNPRAEAIFIKKKPYGVKATPMVAKYVVEYRPQGDKWYFSYSSSEVQFRCRWPKRLFSSNYSLLGEMVVTDRSTDQIEKIDAKSRVRSSDIIVEKLSDFVDEEFWEDYNIIEPDQAIEAVVKRIEKQLKRKR